MKIYKIKNRKLFNAKNYNDKEKRFYTDKEKKNFLDSSHFYASHYNRKTKSYFLIPLTHLYNKDIDRFLELSSGNINKENFKYSETPVGVRNYYLKNDKNGNLITKETLGTKCYTKNHISSKQRKRILKFAKIKGNH